MADQNAPTSGPENRQAIKNQIQTLLDDRIGGAPKVDTDDGTKIVRYVGANGFDYELYREVQELGNKQKLSFQWVPKDHMRAIARIVREEQPDVTFGLCHGTRRGKEQRWLRRFIGTNPEVLGTEISETATQFPNTIQWDFHEVKREWIGATDFIYSNSWDHTYDPDKLFSAWISCLKPGGRLYLDHSRDQSADTVNALDPFGVDLEAFVTLLDKIGKGDGKVIRILDGAENKRAGTIKVVVFEKAK